MKANSTLVSKLILILTLLIAFTTTTTAQTSPNMKFVRPTLFSGNAGQKNAVYKFTNVIAGVDAFITIKDIKDGAYLVNIDDTTMGYYNAWQPIVGGPGAAGTGPPQHGPGATGHSSEMHFRIEFKNTNGTKHSFTNFDISAIDIDGDNYAIREYVDVNGESSSNVPTAIPTLVWNGSVSNPYADSVSVATNLQSVGPIANRPDIDTTALDTRVNYKFINKDKIDVTIGAVVQVPPGNSPVLSTPENANAIATDRYYSMYFKPVSNIILTILPVTLRTFDAVAVNNNAANLFWITEAEMDNDHFEVERSFDQKNFTKIGIVLGAQSSTKTSQQYSFKDAAAELSGHSVIYYRLRQVDVDDNFKYSAIKTVRLTSNTKAFVQLSPNPYMEKLNINFVSEQSGKAQMTLTSVSGQVTSSKESVVTKGYNNIQMNDLNTIAPGVYVANLVINGKTIATQKVVKQ